MEIPPNYIEVNRELWNARTDVHMNSEFYDVPGFLAGATSLKQIELDLLGDIKGKSVLHLQCHFGQDSISLARMGAKVTGVDLSDNAIDKARELNTKAGTDARFVCCDLYELPSHLEEKFDIVFTSYGTIGWLPDMEKWAGIVSRYLRPGGEFVFADFHPVAWMFDDHFKKVAYSYFNKESIIETESGTYADRDSEISKQYIGWNHGMAEVLQSLLDRGLTLKTFREFDYSPYNCFHDMVEVEAGKFMITGLEAKLPLVFALKARITSSSSPSL